MTALVSVAQAKARLLFDHDYDDADFELMIAGASAAVLTYLKLERDAYADSSGNIPEDSNGDPIGVPEEVQNATLILVGIMKRDPSGAQMKDWEYGYLPMPVTALLYPLRTLTLA